MDKEYYASLAEVRLSRAKELLKEAQYLLEKESFKSANNRAFYAGQHDKDSYHKADKVEVSWIRIL